MRAIYIDVPGEELVARVAGRSVCPTDGTAYHDISDPPAVPGICDRDGTPLVKRDDDRPEVVRDAAGQAGAAHARGGEALRGCGRPVPHRRPAADRRRSRREITAALG